MKVAGGSKRCPELTWLPRSLAVGLIAALCAGAASAQKSERAIPPFADGGTANLPMQIVARHETTLSSEMAGRIDTVATQTGDHFRRGDVLVTFDCTVPRAQASKAQAAVTESERTYEIDRRQAAQKPTGQLELDVAAAEVLKAKADLATAEAVASRCAIMAPFAGVTVEQKARPFEYATPGQALLELRDDRALAIEFNAPSRWLRWLKPGIAFAIEIDETGKTYPARIVRLGDRVDPGRSIHVTGEINGEAADVKPGMRGWATVKPP
jgi:membrane fusion protein (multidrug efflux system)